MILSTLPNKSAVLKRAFFFSLFILAAGLCIFSQANAQTEFSENTSGISTEEFVSSQAAQLFQIGKYPEAIAALDGLLKTYPKDPLLIRYRAMAMDQMGNSKDAIKIFEDLLLEYPDHLPTHYFLGQAYARDGQQEKASKEWRWVLAQGEGTPYQAWAQASLDRFEGKGAAARQAPPAKIQRWNIIGRYGYEYDSNVTLKPSDKSVSPSSDKNAGRQVLDLGARYRAYSRRDTAIDLLYAMRQSFHDDSLNEFNFHSEEFGINARRRVQINGQDVVLGARYDILLGILDTDFFSLRNRWIMSAETRFTEHTRTVFYDRITTGHYRNDGVEPSLTDRDGLYNDLGVTQYWYSNDFRRYIFFRQEFNSAFADGDNYDSWGTTSRLGFNTPLIKRLDLEASSGLQLGFYPNFSSVSSLDTSRRRDNEWDIYTALTYHLTSRLGVRAFYRYIRAANQNNLFDYDRHIGGMQLIYELSL